ncbi:SDR family NAD(P)-dependent oxidoreductase [Sulfurovum sp. bin170]|uniref:SDR family NAD(P)-dependent oxidoreductase n=1 Tax=Sulfurovum sp. bin170 TaxID=2695268 RepID=UPI0013E02274|nr:SDR family NAD(P)-dependent oxidoreductase [Sulfurovum sp. bin170]NEW60709.1 SDR family NAD(P)-dependent oxidoreductase [Sulfurovum sp. bin170]
MTNIVITGCSTGIGFATAKYLQSHGIKVYATVRDERHLNPLRANGLEHAMKMDVTKPEEISAVIANILEDDGKIDVWFNNAGYGQPGAIEDMQTYVLKEQFDVNVFALHECTRQILPIMREQGFGRIIQHSSILGLVSLKARGAYSASKYAVEGLTDTLRLELKGTNIYPVLLNTGPITSSFRKTAMKKLKENIDIENSIFKDEYKATLSEDKTTVPFNEEAISVAEIVYEIIVAKRPKPRYYITRATYLLVYLKRVLSTARLDKILFKI